jgi:LemA protein
MSPLLTVIAIVGGVIALTGIATVLIYNGLRASQYACDDAWSLIDVQLRRRADLVPNLVSVVRGYAAHEQGLLQATTAARATAAAQHEPTASNAAAESELGASIAMVLALREQYPELKANGNFLQLQTTLADLERQIAASREIYNGNVAVYRTKLEQVPSAWVARSFSFPSRDLFALRDVRDRLPASVAFDA